METIVEEGRKNRQRKYKLKDQPDKEEGIRGRPMILGIICHALLLMSPAILLSDFYPQINKIRLMNNHCILLSNKYLLFLEFYISS